MIDADGRPVEIELKFAVDDAAALERLLAGPELGPFTVRDDGVEIRTDDRYVDTADRRLLAGGYVCRLRHARRRTVVTLKSAATIAGAEHRRTELEAEAWESLDPRAWPPSEPRAIVLELAGDAPLVTLGEARQVRRLRELVAGGTRVELSLDRVEVLADGGAIDRWTELEAELLAGDEALLRELAGVLAAAGLAPSPTSKMERALAATERHRAAAAAPATEITEAAGEPAPASGGSAPAPEPVAPAAPPLKTPGVRPDDPLAEAGRKVLRFHFERMVARERGTRLGEDPEELHKMRVATRRMRAAWRVFGPAFRGKRTRALIEHLRVVAGRLGAVRDLDVLIEGLEAYRATLPEPERPGLAPLLDELRDQRFEARIRLARELDSERYADWVEELGRLTTTVGLYARPAPPAQPLRVRETMGSSIWRAYEHVRAYEPILPWADEIALHALRIEAKRLRYTIEFVRDALAPEAADLVARIVTLQDHLGELNDAVVAGGLARDFLVRSADALDEAATIAVGRYVASREREVERLRASIGPAWDGIAGPAFRELLGRVTASL